tara:strand:+ start:242 stop:550 length:309 start_codon:yes stop_codon:yes gene_type:complete
MLQSKMLPQPAENRFVRTKNISCPSRAISSASSTDLINRKYPSKGNKAIDTAKNFTTKAFGRWNTRFNAQAKENCLESKIKDIKAGKWEINKGHSRYAIRGC